MFTDIKDRVWLTPEEIDVLFPLLPTPRGKQRVDDNLVLSGIIFVLRTGCRWRDAPDVYGPHKTLYTRWRRWSKKGLFIGVLAHLALLRMSRERNPKRKDAHMDATHCKAHPRACCGVCHTEELGRLIDKTKGGQNTKVKKSFLPRRSVELGYVSKEINRIFYQFENNPAISFCIYH